MDSILHPIHFKILRCQYRLCQYKFGSVEKRPHKITFTALKCLRIIRYKKLFNTRIRLSSFGGYNLYFHHTGNTGTVVMTKKDEHNKYMCV